MVHRGDSRSEHDANDGGRSIAGTVAACAALASFAIAVVAGISSGNAAKVVLVRSIVSRRRRSLRPANGVRLHRTHLLASWRPPTAHNCAQDIDEEALCLIFATYSGQVHTSRSMC